MENEIGIENKPLVKITEKLGEKKVRLAFQMFVDHIHTRNHHHCEQSKIGIIL